MNREDFTYYAPAERDNSQRLHQELDSISNNPVIDSILTAVGGLLVVLNDKRQMITANQTLLNRLGIRDIESLLGKRLGEAVECIHCNEMPGGCGTSSSCRDCGAVIAMMAGLTDNETREETCNIRRKTGEETGELSFSIRACPMEVEGSRYLLFFLRDISAEERWNAIERVFFHDLNNVIGSIMGSTTMLKLKNNVSDSSQEASLLNKVILRLTQEVREQKLLWETRNEAETARKSKVTVTEVCDSMEELLTGHPSRNNKVLEIEGRLNSRTLFTNKTILLRILTNMLINAFEAAEEEETVRFSADSKDDGVIFSVWNRQFIPDDRAGRLFDQDFTTKEEAGHGLGTFGMKLFGEQILGGQVNFMTHPGEGTTFTLFIPTEER